MKQLKDFKEDIHRCSKCGLCQAECPVYKVTGNDCTVSRGQFAMLKGVINGDLKMTKTVNRYLNLCLKCGACSKFCPAGIDVVDIIVAAKSEYFKTHKFEGVKSFIKKNFVFKLIPNIIKFFRPKTVSKTFDKKVIYFGGCGSKIKGDAAVIKLLNSINIEVINPIFPCCGISLFTGGDLEGFKVVIDNFVSRLKQYNVREIVTTCASCEKALKDYVRWTDSDENKEFLASLQVKNIYEYLSGQHFILKKPVRVTFHKPCNIDNYEDIQKVLNNTVNLEYIKMDDFDKCCGLAGISKLKEYKTMTKIFFSKRNNIIKTRAKYVLTSCLGCEAALRAYSFGKYKVCDLIEFIADRM